MGSSEHTSPIVCLQNLLSQHVLQSLIIIRNTIPNNEIQSWPPIGLPPYSECTSTMVQTSIVLLFLLLALSNALLRTSLRKSSRSLLVTRFAAVERVESLTVDPITSINGEVTLPGSKSLSNRVLLLAALAEGTTRVENLLDSADIRWVNRIMDYVYV